MAFPKLRAAKAFRGNWISLDSPGKKEKRMRLLLILGLYSLFTFAVYLFNQEHLGIPALCFLLSISLSCKFLRKPFGIAAGM